LPDVASVSVKFPLEPFRHPWKVWLLPLPDMLLWPLCDPLDWLLSLLLVGDAVAF
jgi:hypothetical protein